MSEPGAVPAQLPRLLFVGGMPRSGSTLFDLMVGQLPGFCDIGELFYLWQAGPLRDQRCACGHEFSSCPFWQQVGDVAFGGWTRVDIPAFLDLQRRVDSTSRLPLAALGRALPHHDVDVSTYRDILLRTYAAVSQVSGAEVVVDSTKRPSTMFLLAGDERLDFSLAHVVRDPRGVVNAWSRQVALPANTGARDHLITRPLRQTVRRWLSVNLMTEQLSRRGVPTVRIRYEDLVTDPRAAMRAVLGLMNRPVTDDAISFVGPDGLSVGHSHAATGGRIRMQSGTMPLRLDEKWRRELPVSKQRITVAASAPLMRRYGYL